MIDCKKCVHYPVCFAFDDICGEGEACVYYEEKRPHGEWKFCTTGSRSIDVYRCSVCGASEEILKGGDMSILRPYCRCGAKMGKEGEAE